MYSIGEFSNLVGVTSGTLRSYEKYNILIPFKNETNSYRFYNDLDARTLLISRWYRSMGFSVEETAEMIQKTCLNQSKKGIEKLIDDLKIEIDEKSLKLQRLKEIESDITSIDKQLDHCSIELFEGYYRFDQTNQNKMIKDHDMEPQISAWMSYLPFTHFTFKMEYEKCSESVKSKEYTWGMTLSAKYTDALKVNTSHPLIGYYPEQMSATTIISVKKEELLSSNHLDKLFTFIEEHNFKVSGDIIGRFILNDCIDSQEVGYCKVYIPIR